MRLLTLALFVLPINLVHANNKSVEIFTYQIFAKNIKSKVKVIVLDTNDIPISEADVIIYQNSQEIGKGLTDKNGVIIIDFIHPAENMQMNVVVSKKGYQKISITSEIHTPLTSFSFVLKKSNQNNSDIKLDIIIEDKEIFKVDNKK